MRLQPIGPQHALLKNALGRTPFVAARGRAAAVEARRVVAAVRLEAVEHDRVALERLDGQALLGALGPLGALRLDLRVREDGLAAFIGGFPVTSTIGIFRSQT